MISCEKSRRAYGVVGFPADYHDLQCAVDERIGRGFLRFSHTEIIVRSRAM